ncbi:DUF6807 domain-containing protein [Agromyces albus]|uniref:DUF6807 domain-containing protein n=1 Tax=Agromyces albus TaxID=205332 RepID=UPI002780A4B8|nr:PmoA family protein [Agromyces albus]MDQ0574472.1 hypothetical protein [Agromyces albus]
MSRIRIDTMDGRLGFTADSVVLAEYVHRPDNPQLESPRPYFSPIRTRAGELVSLYRPHDHVWHKGITWSLPVVGDENFWGGPTFVDRRGYVQLPNNGTQGHREFPVVDDESTARFVEALDWVTEGGEQLFEEQRIVGATLLDDDSWLLAFATSMRNVSGRLIPIGSPTTRGRENAGYGGLFWRGPRSFTGGSVLAPGIAGGDELRGTRAPWMGFTGRHDVTGAASTIVMIDDPGNLQHPPQWFARSEEFACLCPAPFFSEEHEVEPGATLDLRYGVVIADGASDPDRAAALAAAGSARLPDLLNS